MLIFIKKTLQFILGILLIFRLRRYFINSDLRAYLTIIGVFIIQIMMAMSQIEITNVYAHCCQDTSAVRVSQSVTSLISESRSNSRYSNNAKYKHNYIGSLTDESSGAQMARSKYTYAKTYLGNIIAPHPKEPAIA